MSGRVYETAIGEGGVEVTIENDSRMNALTVSMWHDLADVFRRVSSRSEVRFVVIRGAGFRAFSAGADISEFEVTRATRGDVETFHENTVGATLRAILECPVPVIAAIRGICMGGGLEVASACDIRIGDDTARLGAPVGRLGFPLAFGETELLFKLVGYVTCVEILVEGRVFSAEEALGRRLLNRVCSPESLDAELAGILDSILQNGAAATRAHKKQLRRLMTDSSPVTFAERQDSYSFADSDEYQTGFRSFLERSARRSGAR